MIEALGSAISPLGNTPASGVGQPASGGSDSGFGSLMRNAIEKLEQGQHDSEQEMARAVAGESPDLHRTVIALQTQELNFQLALQVRNKVIGAYEEIMRMQV